MQALVHAAMPDGCQRPPLASSPPTRTERMPRAVLLSGEDLHPSVQVAALLRALMAHLGLRAVGAGRDTIRPNPCGNERISHRLDPRRGQRLVTVIGRLLMAVQSHQR